MEVSRIAHLPNAFLRHWQLALNEYSQATKASAMSLNLLSGRGSPWDTSVAVFRPSHRGSPLGGFGWIRLGSRRVANARAMAADLTE
jgi:hypothetical protein